MNKQQQELYDKLLKKVNEFCLGQAAEDVIECIDALVTTYEEPKKIVGTTTIDKALEQFLIDSYPAAAKKYKALDILKYRSVNVLQLQVSSNCRHYNHNFDKYSGRNLTQEEYNLLKEILK